MTIKVIKFLVIIVDSTQFRYANQKLMESMELQDQAFAYKDHD